MCKGRDQLAAIARAHNILMEFVSLLEAYEHGIFAVKPGTKPHLFEMMLGMLEFLLFNESTEVKKNASLINR